MYREEFTIETVYAIVVGTSGLLYVNQGVTYARPCGVVPTMTGTQGGQVINIGGGLDFKIGAVLCNVMGPFQVAISYRLIAMGIYSGVIDEYSMFRYVFYGTFIAFGGGGVQFGLTQGDAATRGGDYGTLGLIEALFIPNGFFTTFAGGVYGRLGNEYLTIATYCNGGVFQRFGSSRGVKTRFGHGLSQRATTLTRRSSSGFRGLTRGGDG